MNEWIKRNKLYITLVVMLLICLSWIVLREMKIDRDNGKMAGLQVELLIAQKNRDAFKLQAGKLQESYDSLQIVKKLAEEMLKQKTTELYWLQAKHKKEIDSLLNKNVPIDTVYIRTGYLYPNFDGGSLSFGFSGSQLQQIYGVGITYPRMKLEYEVSKETLAKCYLLNNQYQQSEDNLKKQMMVCIADTEEANKQITVQNAQIGILNTKIKRKTFFNIILESGFLSGWIYAAFK